VLIESAVIRADAYSEELLARADELLTLAETGARYAVSHDSTDRQADAFAAWTGYDS